MASITRGINNPGKGVTLTDENGTELTKANDNGKNKKLYKIPVNTDEIISYFYIDVAGIEEFKLTNIFLSIDQARTLIGTLQFYRDGAWVDNPAYNFNFTTDEAQKLNGLYPFEELHHCFPKRVKCIVGSGTTCELFCQVVVI